MSDAYEKYLAAERAVSMAENWMALPHGPRYQGDRFDISPAHCTLKLQRAGQQSCGGQNYWEAPKELASALLRVLAKSEDMLAPAMSVLRMTRDKALADCREYVDDLSARIAKAEGRAE